MIMCAYTHNTVFNACSLYSDLSIHMYLISNSLLIYDFHFNLTYHCPYLYAWTTSLDHIHVWLSEYADWFYLTYSLGCFLTTPDLHVQILEPGLWWPFYSWSEYAMEAWISCCLSGPYFLPALFDRLARFSSCYSWLPSSLFIFLIMPFRFLVI